MSETFFDKVDVEVVNPRNLNAEVKALKDTILVKNIERGIKRLKSGLLLPDDNMKESGIRSRWGEVYSVGSEVKKKYDIKEGEWVLVKHGRWSRGIPVKTPSGEFYLHKVEIESILLVSDEKPEDLEYHSSFKNI